MTGVAGPTADLPRGCGGSAEEDEDEAEAFMGGERRAKGGKSRRGKGVEEARPCRSGERAGWAKAGEGEGGEGKAAFMSF